MKTEVKKLEKCQVQLTVSIEAEEAATIIKNVEKTFVREVKVPGFRPGKVPLEMVRKQFAGGIKEESVRMMYSKNIAKAIEESKAEVIDIVNIKEASITAEGGSFVAIADVKPEFKLPTYKGLKVELKDATVSDSDVEDSINRLRAAYASYEDAKEGEAAAEGDFVQIDYSGTVDGKPIVEINPEAKFVSSAENYWLQLEEGRFLPEILEAVKGMKIGETKSSVKAKFDKEAAPEGLKGAKAVYTVTLKAFRRRVLPTDEQFVEKAKAESLEKLTAQIREQMQTRATEAEATRRENEVVELLLKKSDFDVPGSQVQRVKDGILAELAERAKYSGLGADYFEQNREKIDEDATKSAVNQVRLWYLFDAIAGAEKIEAKDNERGKKVVEFLLANAKN
ncbi:MAG: trigger factor [Kiritimatiellae bacterium]|nr:trigger factor [Kiritimatiellia bacterium]